MLSCTSRGCACTLSRGPHVLDQRQKSHLLQPSGCYSMADTWDDYLSVSEGFGKEMIQRAVVPWDIKAKHSKEIAAVHQEEKSTACYAARGPSGSPAV